jgi:hypothetical protein
MLARERNDRRRDLLRLLRQQRMARAVEVQELDATAGRQLLDVTC